LEPYKIIASGRTAELLEYGEGTVLKLLRDGFPPHEADDEFALSKLIYEAGVPCPKPYEVVDLHNRRGIVYERVIGDTMLRTIAKQPWRTRNEAKRMAHAHAETHKRSVDGLPSQKKMLEWRIRAAPYLADGEKDRIVKYLHALPDGSQLCHGDYHPDNVMCGDRFFVIDWMNAVSGNAAGDVARSVLLLRFGTLPDDMPALLRSFFSFARSRMLSRYEAAYRKETGMLREEIEAWMLPYAAARLVEGVPEAEKIRIVSYIKNRLDQLDDKGASNTHE